MKGKVDKMDKQTNNLQIPVNTRTVGTPSGIYILYLEDYVHTFINKLLAEKNASDNEQTYEISLFGRRFEEEGRSLLVISGAAENPFSEDKGRQCFPSCSYLGNARIETNKDSKLRLEVTIRNTNIVLDDFYIYYDQNEEMQNYLIDWNLNHQSVHGESFDQSTHYKASRVRAETDEAVRYGRIAQAYNREEARVSFIWNVMNVLSLGLVMCIMVYGIISINNYQKMKSMEKTIDYCLALITETLQQNNAVTVNSNALSTDNHPPITSDIEPSAQVQTEQQAAQVSNDTTAEHTAQQPTAAGIEKPTEQTDIQNKTEIQAEPATDAYAQITADNSQNNTQISTPQYYIVRRGDTLRTISYEIYGTYDMVDEICEWNNIENPDNILYGQRLLLP